MYPSDLLLLVVMRENSIKQLELFLLSTNTLLPREFHFLLLKLKMLAFKPDLAWLKWDNTGCTISKVLLKCLGNLVIFYQSFQCITLLDLKKVNSKLSFSLLGYAKTVLVKTGIMFLLSAVYLTVWCVKTGVMTNALGKTKETDLVLITYFSTVIHLL